MSELTQEQRKEIARLLREHGTSGSAGFDADELADELDPPPEPEVKSFFLTVQDRKDIATGLGSAISEATLNQDADVDRWAALRKRIWKGAV